MDIVLSVLIFALSVSIFNLILDRLTSRQRRVEERLQFALNKQPKQPILQGSPGKKSIKSWIRLLAVPGTVLNSKSLDKIQLELIKAGIPLKAEEMIGLQGLALIVFMGLGQLLFQQALGVIFLGILGVVLPVFIVKFKKTQRIKKFEGQLFDAVLLLANALRAGHSSVQGMEIISKNMPSPLAGEFRKVSLEMRIGMTLDDALMNLTQRIESKDIEMVVTGLSIQRQIGGNMAEILDNIAYTIDKRIKNRLKIEALTAQSRLSAWIVSLLPIVLAVFIFGLHPEFGGIMFEEPLGIIMLVSGGVMMALGILVIRVVIRIDI